LRRISPIAFICSRHEKPNNESTAGVRRKSRPSRSV
jgi:hypothetical protein